MGKSLYYFTHKRPQFHSALNEDVTPQHQYNLPVLLDRMLQSKIHFLRTVQIYLDAVFLLQPKQLEKLGDNFVSCSNTPDTSVRTRFKTVFFPSPF